MKKTTTQGNSFRIRSNSSFQKTLKKESSHEFLHLPQLPFHQAKTVRVSLKKKTDVPILKFGKFVQCSRPKLFSVDGSLQKAMETQRLRRREQVSDDSFKNGKNNSTGNTEEAKLDSSSAQFDAQALQNFPPVTRNHRKIDQTEKRKKKAKNTVQCKVLISKNNQFPFIGQKTKGVQRKNSQKLFEFHQRTISDDVNEVPFSLEDSMIIGNENIDEDSIPFISKDSLHQLLIF